MRTLYVWIFVAAAVLSIGIGVVMFVRMVGRAATRAATSPPPPPDHAIRVTGHGAEKLTAPHLTWSLDVCADSAKLARDHAKEAIRRGQKVFAEDLVMGEVDADDGQEQDVHTCATVELSTTKVAEAFRWQRGLIAAKLVDQDSSLDPECSGEEGVAAAKARAAMTAIKDARAQADALLEGAGTAGRAGLEADVTHEEGSWDARCERIITAEATLTVPTK